MPLKWLKNLLPLSKLKALEEENKELKEKLAERQNAINKTNAYWKKKLRELTRKGDSN